MGSFLKCLMIQDFKDYTFTNLCQSWLVNFMVCMINMLIFISIITVFYFFIFCSLIARDKCLLFYKRAILSFGYHMLIFLSVVFSLRTKHVTSQHNL